ncbi:hypothetical protein CWC38_04975 [Kocuria tytonicola]|uniref:hypothetical protein n=1 Tax=Kocuria tytonicola TaxID=2055946 RepID=UPI000EF85861|nr:hypothetical protein [Kocuria tytonicola]RLZ03583.1 hypothetical protein CWC38_04975 [Kocuria tytonicola]
MTQHLQGLDTVSAPAHRSSALRVTAAAALAVSMLFASVGPSVAVSQGDSVRGPSSALCRFFPIYCNPR